MTIEGNAAFQQLLDPEERLELLTRVHDEDVRRATLLIDEAIRAAGEAWIPIDAVMDAFGPAYASLALRSVAPQRAVLILEQLASLLRERGAARLSS